MNYRPMLEELERRDMPSTLLVTDAGDSITHFTPGVSYADVAAIQGAQAADVLAALPAEFARTHATLTLVQVGTNDLWPMHNSDGTLTYENVNTFRATVQAIVDTCHAYGSKVVLTTIPDAADGGRELMQYALNAEITRVAVQNEVDLWDYRSTLQSLPGQGLAIDGIHPSPIGFNLRAQERQQITTAFQDIQQSTVSVSESLLIANALVRWGDQ